MQAEHKTEKGTMKTEYEIDELTHQYLHKIDILDNGNHTRNLVNDGAIIADIILLSGQIISKQDQLIEDLKKQLRQSSL